MPWYTFPSTLGIKYGNNKSSENTQSGGWGLAVHCTIIKKFPPHILTLKCWIYMRKIRRLYIFLAFNDIFVYISCSASVPRVRKVTVTYGTMFLLFSLCDFCSIWAFLAKLEKSFGPCSPGNFCVNTHAYLVALSRILNLFTYSHICSFNMFAEKLLKS